jgi:hypothetical protein
MTRATSTFRRTRINHVTAAIGCLNVPCCFFPFATFSSQGHAHQSQKRLFTNQQSGMPKQTAARHDDRTRVILFDRSRNSITSSTISILIDFVLSSDIKSLSWNGPSTTLNQTHFDTIYGPIPTAWNCHQPGNDVFTAKSCADANI